MTELLLAMAAIGAVFTLALLLFSVRKPNQRRFWNNRQRRNHKPGRIESGEDY